MTTATLTSQRSHDTTLRNTRLASVDIIRGAVIVLMAIDHVRVYSGLPPGGPDPGIFFTRWITHFCAPVFVFLAGTSAFLYGIKTSNKAHLAKFLLVRGLLLVILEVTLVRFFWTFNMDYSGLILAGVIWMIGWSMVLMAALVFLKPVVVGIIGVAIIALQDLFAKVPGIVPTSALKPFGYFWEFIYPSGLESWPAMGILYVIVPWIGVMAAGYGFGTILLQPAQKRRRTCLWIGLTAMVLFIAAGTALILTSSDNNSEQPFIFQLLNQRKYPASQLYLLMTLGPAIALMPLVENAKGWVARVLATFGKVPMFYYLMHLLIIHLTALLVVMIREGRIFSEWYASAPFAQVPEENRWPLALLYLVFAVDIVLLYFMCRWYANYKLSHPQIKWLKYL